MADSQDTQAEQFFLERRHAHSQAALRAVEAEVEALDQTPQGRSLIALAESNPREAELLGAQMAFKQISATFASLFSVDFTDADLRAAGARRGPLIAIALDPEAAQRQYETFFGSLATSFFTPEERSKLTTTVSTTQVYSFEDGSLISLVQADPNALQTHQRLLASARSHAELVADKDSRVAEVASLFERMGGQVGRDLRQHLAHASQQDLDALFNDFSFKTIKAIMTLPRASTPAANPEALSARLLEKHSDGAAWKEGVTVQIDGAPAATPADFNLALGCEPPMDLSAALARLRASGVSQARSQSAQAPSAPKKPSGPKA